MAQSKAMLNMIKVKLEFITEEKSRLIADIDSYVIKHTSEATAALEKGSSAEDVRHLRDINSRLDTALQLILKMGDTFHNDENVETQSTVQPTDQCTPSYNSYSKICDQRLENLEITASFQDESNQSNSKQISSLEEEFHALESEIQNLKAKNAELEKGHVTRFSKIMNHISELDERTNQIKERQESLHEQQKLAEIDFANTFVSKSDFTEHTEWVKKTNQTFETLGMKVTYNTVDLKDVTNTCKNVEATTKELASKMALADRTMQSLKQTNNAGVTRRREMEEKLTAVVKKQEVMESFRSMVEQGDVVNKNIYKLIASRLEPLNKLQTIFNTSRQSPSRIEVLDKKVNELKEMFDELSTRRAGTPESRGAGVLTGFTAYLKSPQSVKSETVLGDYKHKPTFGSYFTASSGVFTAPVDGLYLFFLSLKQAGPGKVRAHLKIYREDDTGTFVVCKAMTAGDGSSTCGLGVSHMGAGDVAAVRIVHVEGDPKLSPYTSFSGCLIGRGT
ncbi:cilia- and flagella-associated protein 57-like [Physella acuta]|uniref:cilia- and flagella-associated protein 57-like n=1 Tax=Physella acuta TaxID=109671 RepID=UPI0027DBA9A0|nr:cilia- and flagella-associated protein 57-like [Physella acuta]